MADILLSESEKAIYRIELKHNAIDSTYLYLSISGSKITMVSQTEPPSGTYYTEVAEMIADKYYLRINGVLTEIKRQGSVNIAIPSKLFAVVGKEFNLYYDTLGLMTSSGDAYNYPYLFDIVCSVGLATPKSYRFTPTTDNLNAGAIKEYPLTIYVYDTFGNVVETKTSSIVVVPAVIFESTNLMFVGDSNTTGLHYAPDYVQEYFDAITPNSINEVGTFGYKSRSDIGADKFYAHTAISGAGAGTFSEKYSNVYIFYKCAITGFTLKERREYSVDTNLIGGSFTILRYNLDANGDGFIWLRNDSGVPTTGSITQKSDNATVIGTITSVSIAANDGVFYTDNQFDVASYLAQNGIVGNVGIISIDLGINDAGQGGVIAWGSLTDTNTNLYINYLKTVIDGFKAHNPNTKIIVNLPKSPALSRLAKCQDGYRINLQAIRNAIITAFDNNVYGANVIVGNCGLAIDRKLGYYLQSDINAGNVGNLMSTYFPNTDRFISDYNYEGFHPNVRGYSQITYSVLGAIIYANYLQSLDV